MGMVASMVELAGVVSSKTSSPVMPVNWPFTFEIIMCFTLNSAAECAGSIFQVVVVAVMVYFPPSQALMPGIDIRCNKYFAGL